MTAIQFNNVLPNPLKDLVYESQIWRKGIELKSKGKYLIMADSGRGKSTFLNILYGIRKDFTGIVTVDNKDILSLSDADISKLRTGYFAYLFQDLRLFGSITAKENILLKPGCKFNPQEIEIYAQKLGVEQFLNKKCNTLSLGQQQRISLLRALSQPFKWLLLDEPFSHVDKHNAAKMMELIYTRCAEENAGIIATSLGENEGFESFDILQL